MLHRSFPIGLAALLAAALPAQAGTALVARTAAERQAVDRLVAQRYAQVIHEIDGRTAAVYAGAPGAAEAPVRLRAEPQRAAIAALSAADRARLLRALETARIDADRAQADVYADHLVDRAARVAMAATAAATAAVPAAPPGANLRPGWYDTSEYLYGSIAVNVIFVNSTGSDHRFSAADREDAMSDLVEALDMWRIDLPKSKLSFKYRTHIAWTTHDPIEERSTDRKHWMAQVLSSVLGKTVAPNDHYEATYELNNKARNELGTNWALTVFFVKGAEDLGDVWDAISDPKGEFVFKDGQTPFAMLGGPYICMPYSRIAGIHFWNAGILTHEFGHIFYALDEYEQYAKEGHTPSERSGYFQVQNGNLDTSGAPSDVSCIMRGSFKYVLDYVLDHAVSIFIWGDEHSWSYPICSYTRGMMGCRDADGDGTIDPLDVAPVVTLSATTTATRVNVSGTARIGARANQNPYDRHVHPAGAKRDINLDSLSSLRYRVNGGAWQTIALGGSNLPGKTISLSIPGAPGQTLTICVEARTKTGQVTTRTVTRTLPAVSATRATAAAAAAAVYTAAPR